MSPSTIYRHFYYFLSKGLGGRDTVKQVFELAVLSTLLPILSLHFQNALRFPQEADIYRLLCLLKSKVLRLKTRSLVSQVAHV